MEYAIIQNDLEEKEIKPKALLGDYRNLMAKDIASLLPLPTLEKALCPCCSSSQIVKSFSKLGMTYDSCAECQTLYVNPRPSKIQIENFFKKSEARHFWLKRIWPQTSKARRKKIIEPLLDWMRTLIQQNFSTPTATIAEIYPSSWSLIESWEDKPSTIQWQLVDPYFPIELSPKLNHESAILSASTANTFEGICLLDTIGRVANPLDLLRWSADHLKNSGLCFITTLFSTGFDFLTLGSEAVGLTPLDHLNIFSYEGLKEAIKNLPFEILEWSTPGVLDLQNVQEAIEDNRFTAPPFFRYIFEKRKDPELITAFQELLQHYQLSSQGRILLKKRERS